MLFFDVQFELLKFIFFIFLLNFALMKKLLSVVTGLIFMISTSVFAEEKLTIEKQLVGIVGAISGTVKTETR